MVAHQQAEATHAGIECGRIKPEPFMMGSEDSYVWTSPMHEVTIREPFELGKHPVTQEQ